MLAVIFGNTVVELLLGAIVATNSVAAAVPFAVTVRSASTVISPEVKGTAEKALAAVVTTKVKEDLGDTTASAFMLVGALVEVTMPRAFGADPLLCIWESSV